MFANQALGAKGDAYSADFSGLSVSAVSRPADIASDWKYLENYGNVPFSDYSWAIAWYESQQANKNITPIIVIGRDANNHPLFVLPFVYERRGPFRILTWPGHKHSAYRSGLFSPACRDMVTSANARDFWAMVFAVLPQTDAIAAYGLPVLETESCNPLSYLPNLKNGCVSYRTIIPENWEALYLSKISSKMRSNNRRCERRIAEQGQLRFQVAENREERLEILDNLIDHKSAHLVERGALNIFDDPSTRFFYKRLIESDEGPKDKYVFLSALRLNDQIIAANLGLVHGKCYYGMISSMARGEFEKFGPGRLLLRRSMEHLCRHGVNVIDFGVGEDRHKTHWYDEIVDREDVLVWFTLKGWAFISALKVFLKAKPSIKRSQFMLGLLNFGRRCAAIPIWQKLRTSVFPSWMRARSALGSAK